MEQPGEKNGDGATTQQVPASFRGFLARRPDQLRSSSAAEVRPQADDTFGKGLDALVRLLARQAAHEHWRARSAQPPMLNER
jgi:hypothetical protein